MPKPRVLVIDDDLLIAKLLKDHLTEEGCDVSAAHLAETGFKMATQTPPDLIFLDVMLPDATGFQTLGRLRENGVTKAIPIIMMTGTARNSNQKAISLGMGASDYFLKPFNVLAVGQRVKELLGDKLDAAASEAPAAEPPMPDLPIAEPPAPELPVPSPQEPEPPAKTPVMEVLPITKQVLEPALTFSNIDSLVPPLHAVNDSARPTLIPMRQAPVAWTPPPEPPRQDSSPPAGETEPAAAAVDSAPPSMEQALETQPEDVPSESPLPVEPWEAPRPALRTTHPRGIAGLMFLIYMGLVFMAPSPDTVRALSYAAGGWALLVGYLVAACAILSIPLQAEEALTLVGWASVPIVVRMGLGLMGVLVPKVLLPIQELWIRPLDLFEIVAIGILGFGLQRPVGRSRAKAALAVVLIAAGWLLTSRGYFHPH